MRTIMPSASGWRLERNDRLLQMVVDSHAAAFTDTGPARSGHHAHPAWKLVLPLGGSLVLDGAQVAGALVPQVSHTCSADRGFIAVYFDPWCFSGPSQITSLTSRQANRYRDALRGDGDLTAVLHEVRCEFGEPVVLDHRLAHVLSRIDTNEPIPSLARSAALSPARLRALSRQTAGVPLVRIRQWARIRSAVLALGEERISDAAAIGGYSDQAHFTRSTQLMLGRTPGSLLGGPRANAREMK